MRAVLDANVLISAMLAPNGFPAKLIQIWLDGGFELIISRCLLDEFQRAARYPKLRSRIDESDISEIVDLLCRGAELIDDLEDPRPFSPDPDDDYLLALAETSHSVLVSGDQHLLALKDDFPIYSPKHFLDLLVDIQ